MLDLIRLQNEAFSLPYSAPSNDALFQYIIKVIIMVLNMRIQQLWKR